MTTVPESGGAPGGTDQIDETALAIRPFEKNRAYWQYKGKPVLLLGGSVEDDLFQIPDLEEQLDLLVECGGNFVRCTMSGRDEWAVWPYRYDYYARKYDVSRFNEEYWRRFANFLTQTARREIIVQIEIWATYDFYERAGAPWRRNPLNPENNLNYTSEQSRLPVEWPYLGFDRINPFFETVPEMDNNELVLDIQRAFVDRLLCVCIDHHHVLYCIDNETNADPRWSAYWAAYIRRKAADAGVEILVTEMFDSFDPSGGEVPGAIVQDTGRHLFAGRSNVTFTIDHPELFDFVEVSNHNAQRGEAHYQTGLWSHRKVEESASLRPVHCVKMYGGYVEPEWAGTVQDAEERFWRNIFSGLAGCRFHRPPWGLGLNDLAQRHIRSMRMMTAGLDLFSCQPASDLLSDHQENTAFCLSDPGRVRAVLFLTETTCRLDISGLSGDVRTIHWLDIRECRWLDTISAARDSALELRTPNSGMWVALVE